MKKRMFITTIVMTLVLAIALTTSSLAWFSSANMTVTAQAAEFTAASANSANVSLKISRTTGSFSNSIALTSKENLQPAIPVKALVSEYKDGETINFETDVHGTKTNAVYGSYFWPNAMQFNKALIDSNDEFVILSDNNGKLAGYTPVEFKGAVKTQVEALNKAVDDAQAAYANDNNDQAAVANLLYANSNIEYATYELNQTNYSYIYDKDANNNNKIVIEILTETEELEVTEDVEAEFVTNPELYVSANNALTTTERNDTAYCQRYKAYVFIKVRMDATGSDVLNNTVTNLVANTDFYYDTFYLMNADMQNPINSLTFGVKATVELPDNNADVNTATSFVAFIISRRARTYAVEFEKYTAEEDEELAGQLKVVGGKYVPVASSLVKIPDNAFNNAGMYVLPYVAPADQDKIPYQFTAQNSISLAQNAEYAEYFVPFAAFTFKIADSTTSQNLLGSNAWQYADLDERAYGATNKYYDEYFKYNGVAQADASIKTQNVDVVANASGTNKFTLNTTNLKGLNNKGQEQADEDNTSTFAMYGKEIFKVDIYFWLDGLTLNEYTDASITNFSIDISAAQ